ncbi:hypothetical protein BBJ29_000180 [Phytophthora kernoviae]|uniref:Cas12f1-like TNB domain-containing protein n=1 Tax=Phytophthora kernoviae TaxID=325452 RepID=A0A3F2S3G8_9STRA|nr:hypothetical protein BBJ29_000180 [Phytophthora kernoviae]RLN69475.1 hypothetical protein BBP00_00000349 [Phytophthora kernoviae]
MSAQLFEAQQQISAQAEKLQLNSDRTALEDDLQQEIHLLRSENMKLNETIATLSSRPFDALSNDLVKKNIWIAQLEEEKRELEADRANFQNECSATRRASDHLRRRIETLTTETNDLANQLTQAKAECEQQTMQKESHFKFKTLVKYKMDCVGGRVVECEEEYTSKTCSSCGGIKDNFGGSSTYKCSFCHVVYDRDVNAAKSIFHKNVQMLV